MTHVAFDNFLTERLDSAHPDALSDRYAVLLPFGVSTQAWLRQGCRDPWAEARREASSRRGRSLGLWSRRKMRPCAERGRRHDGEVSVGPGHRARAIRTRASLRAKWPAEFGREFIAR